MAKIARIPMFDANIEDLSLLIEAFVNQCAAMGHRELAATFPVGKYRATIDLKITEES